MRRFKREEASGGFLVLPAPQEQDPGPGSEGTKEEEQESLLKREHTAPEPQRYLHRRPQTKTQNDPNSFVPLSEGATSSVTCVKLESLLRKEEVCAKNRAE